MKKVLAIFVIQLVCLSYGAGQGVPYDTLGYPYGSDYNTWWPYPESEWPFTGPFCPDWTYRESDWPYTAPFWPDWTYRESDWPFTGPLWPDWTYTEELAPVVPADMEMNVNRIGMDYVDFDLSSPNPALCKEACAKDTGCKACTYVKPGYQGSIARCWLKYSVPTPEPGDCCISWVKP